MNYLEVFLVGFGFVVCGCVMLGVSAMMLCNFWECWKEFKGLRDLKWRLPK